MLSKPKPMPMLTRDYFVSFFSKYWLRNPSAHKDVVYSLSLSEKPSKPSKSIQGCESNLEEAELRYKSHIHERICAEQRAAIALRNLRASEEAYAVVCASLRSLQDDFGESRIGLELAIADIELRLTEVNQEAKSSLSYLKYCEDAANDSMLSLRQAEIDHENSQRSDQRSRAKAIENIECPQPISRPGDTLCDPLSPVPVTSAAAPRTVAPSPPSRESLQAELLDLGVSIGADVGDALLRRIHAAATGASAPYPLCRPASPDSSGGVGPRPVIITGPPRAGAPPPSVRLLCLGLGPACLGPEVAGGGGEARDTRTVLAALGGTAPVQVCCQERHALIVAQSGELFAWGDAAGGRLGVGALPAAAEGAAGAYAAAPVVVEGLRGAIVTQVDPRAAGSRGEGASGRGAGAARAAAGA
jgi:hypothetical protein